MVWIEEAARCLAGELPAGSRMIVFGSQARATRSRSRVVFGLTVFVPR